MQVPLSLCLVVLLAISAAGAEPHITSLGDNENAGEVLLLSTSKLVKLTGDQKSMPGLMKLTEDSKSPVMYYDSAMGGAIGFIGSAQIALVTDRTIQAVSMMSEKEVDAIFDTAEPMPYADFLQKYAKKPAASYPAVPIQLGPSIVVLPLKDEPNIIIICKSSEQLFGIELVGVAADKASVQVKVHQRKWDMASRPALGAAG